MSNNKYEIIYADPPWRYDFSETDTRKIENHYSTMSLQEIKNLSPPSEDNCILFLWATAPKIIEAIDVIQAWGFEYKTQLIWDKEIIGMGYWFRGQHEFLLVGVKGNFSPPKENRVSSVLREKRTNHSKKPEIVRRWISIWYPDYTKIELFARPPKDRLFEDDSYKGWDLWGNEV